MLTQRELNCYKRLLSRGISQAKDIALEMNLPTPAVYRFINNLKRKGFVEELQTFPRSFQAVPPNTAVSSYSQPILKGLFQPESVTKFDQITGREQMFIASARLISEAKKETLIISIGETVPDEIKLAHRDAIERGVDTKFIAHKYTADNQALLKAWVKMGLEVRHSPDSGYHLVICDGEKCLLSASNPQNSAERASVLIHSKYLSSALRDFFYSKWRKSISVKI